MTRRQSIEQVLRADLTDAMIRDVGVSERMAQPFVDSVIECLRGHRLYVPKGKPDYPALLIRAALENGMSVKCVIKEYQVPRHRLHLMFPGGLPKPKVDEQGAESANL